MITRNKVMPVILVWNPFASLDGFFDQMALSEGVCPVINLANFQGISNGKLPQFAQNSGSTFAVALNKETSNLNITLPETVEYVIAPFGTDVSSFNFKKIIYQVTSLDQAIAVKDAYGIIVKGNESGGKIGEDSSFILFQKLINKVDNPIWVQGGIGIHTSAALIAMGASGVVLDYQLSIFPEFRLPENVKSVLRNLDGSETKVIHSHRIWTRPGSVKADVNTSYKEFANLYSESDFDKGMVALGQDIGMASYYYQKYKTLKHFIFAIKEAITGHIKQAKYFEPIRPNNTLAQELGTKFPIAQGPMTRVSDVPEFAQSVAEAGALPFLALALLGEEDARKLLIQTKELMNGKSWGVGILGFVSNEILDPQLKCIEEIKPPVVIIAGGRPSQAKLLEKSGIRAFLHVPSVGLLDSFLKDGAENFIFEGRECGGHVGPLSSFVLWEKQITRLLQEEDLNHVNVFFAGGIHDALSSTMISLMAAPLVARGAKIGVLLGSAYLFTREAVETGAILKQFQQESIKGNETTLLESSPGHVVRCLKTPFVDYFNNRKKELFKSSADIKEISHHLENMNIGRLRIATKGLEKTEGKYISLKPEEQLEKGLYMVGQVVTLRDNIISMQQLHENIAIEGNNILRQIENIELISPRQTPSDIAIIGMACIFPEAKNIDEYWKNILQAKDSITEIPNDRWDKELYYDPKAPSGTRSTSKWGGFIPAIDFDPIEFGIPPQSLAAIEPAQLLSLKVAKEALKDAGYDQKEFDRDTTAVIFGVENGSELAFGYELRGHYLQYFGKMPDEIDQVLPKLTEDSFPGILPSVMSGRIANRLNLGGKNMTVDAACGSSLAAIDSACQELVTGKANMVLAGAADLHNGITEYLKFSSAQALTSEGHCKTFDQEADGISLGEGVGVVVLKRLKDAQRDGDKIYAVIKSVASSSDGKSLGLTAPNKKGQIKVFERAYNYAGISSSEVGLIEAHGTGTLVGDKTELSSMTEFMCQAGALPGQSQLGSVKTQMGHTKCAAGMAGLIRSSLSVYHGIKPPTLNLNKPNAYYNKSLSPFVFNDKASPWLNERRIAGVSAFGFGGTNFHAVIENFNSSLTETYALKQWPVELCVFRAENDDELKKLIHTVKELIKTNGNISLKDISYTLFKLNQKPVQLTIIAETPRDLYEKLDAVLQNKSSHGIYKTKSIEGKIAFLFSGQGSQRINMARDIFVAFPELRKLLNENPEFEKILFPHKVFDQDSIEEQKETIKDTRNAQPLLGIVDYAIAKFLISLGIRPDMLAGHSYGELPALCLSGVIKESDLVQISKKRAISILEAVDVDPGAMVAVSCEEEELKNALEGEEGISMVNHNSPLQWVIAGRTKDIIRICNKLKALNKSFKRLEVACAFHSPLIINSQKIFKEKLNEYSFNNPQIPVWSNTDTQVYPSDPDLIKERLCDHLVKPVRFCEEIQNMVADGAKIFIETGPGNVLTKLAQHIIHKDQITLSTEQSAGDGITKIVDTLAQFIACGKEINFEKLFEDRKANVFELQNVEKYALGKKTIWKVDGGRAVPLNGKLPAHGAQPITQPLIITNNAKTNGEISHSSEADKIVMGYLENIQSIIKAQHNVMLSYLGNNPEDYNPKAVELPVIKQTIATNNKAGSAIHHISKQAIRNDHQTLQTNVDIKAILLETVNEKTGYPIDMLDMNMDLEADLSIDSIKRVEIINVLKEKFGGLATNNIDEGIVEKLASIKTLNGLVDWLNTSIDLNQSPLKVQDVASKEVNNNVNQTAIKDVLLNAVSEKTGYPIDMLDMNMDLEADLSIDSIKRVEIINVLKEKFDGLTTNNIDDGVVEKLASIKTLNGLVDWLSASIGFNQEDNNPVIPDFAEDTKNFPGASLRDVLLSTVSERTGYPVDMLDMDMDMEADLSIDSIKRIEVINELKQKLGGFNFSNIDEDEAVEKLASIKTLKGLMDWLVVKSDESGIIQHKVIHQHISVQETEKDNSGSLTFAQITETLLDAISEKTGYPKDMLEMHMDMEADLSIDSIKRVEIINVVKSKIAFHSNGEPDADDIVEKLASIKTLQGLTDWIFNSLKNTEKNTSIPGLASQTQTEEIVFPENEMFRFVIDFVKSKTPKGHIDLKGKKIAITNDGGLFSKTLKAHLEYQYAIADIVNEGDSLEGYDGFIALELFNASLQPNIYTFFSYIQKLDYKEVSWIFAITDINRHLNESDHYSYVSNLQGYSGFLNSLNKEWKAACRTINIEDQESLNNITSIIVDEFSYQDDCPETFYRNGERHVGVLKKSSWNKSQPGLELEKDSVVLVLGGAQGITAEIVKELSQEMPCKYILVGRSPMPEAINDGILCPEINDIRKVLLTKEKFNTPAELDRKVQKIYKRNQILLTIEALEKTGSRVYYQSLDLTDANAMIQLLDNLYQKHGRIDGVIHAVGHIDDKFFHKKTHESFAKVFSTKVGPLKVLSEHLNKDTKFIILFSSIASVMGNKGQVDYAAANSVLDQAAHVLNKRIKGRAVAINWGPWKGKGMLSEALEKDLLKRGVTSIPLSVGAKAFVNELKFGEEAQVILMTRVEELTQV